MKANIIGLGSSPSLGVDQTTHSDTAINQAKRVSFQLDNKAQAQQDQVQHAQAQQDQVQHAPAQQEMVNGSQPTGQFTAMPVTEQVPWINPKNAATYSAFLCGVPVGGAAAAGATHAVCSSGTICPSSPLEAHIAMFVCSSVFAGGVSMPLCGGMGAQCAQMGPTKQELIGVKIFRQGSQRPLEFIRISDHLRSGAGQPNQAVSKIKGKILEYLKAQHLIEANPIPENYILCDGDGNPIKTLDQLTKAEQIVIRRKEMQTATNQV